jgi:hypothetical protein
MLIKPLDAEYSFFYRIFQIGHTIGNIVCRFHNPGQWKTAIGRERKFLPEPLDIRPSEK